MARWALVTGGAKRIGARIVRQLHYTGFNIAIHFNHSRTQAQQLADECNAIRAESARIYQANLADENELSALAKKIQSEQLAVSLLVNNAACFFPTDIASCTMAQARTLLDTNLLAPYFLTLQLRSLLKENQGSVINLLDIHGQRPLNQYGLYSISKAAMQMATLSLAQELGPDIRVNGIAPGAILWPEQGSAQIQEQITEQIPLKRVGNEDDIANLVLFLSTADYISGQIIAVDGGRSATGFIGG